MFTYLHSYMPETWEAQVRAGLVRDQDGIRYHESIDIAERYKFNEMAKKGGAFWNLVSERRCPLYIDRLQGGCFLEEYPYDMGLVSDYRELLGDRFWGFQMHEWMSNYASDIRRIAENIDSEWTEETVAQAVRRSTPGYAHLFLQSMNAREYAESGMPADAASFLRITEDLFARRQSYTDGMLLPCDSYALAYPMELRLGAKRLMPEIGAQTPDTRVQVAFARGMTKAYRRPFGTYYEPWGGAPFSACCFQRDGLNEWNINRENFPYSTAGENGGSSRSLQRRLHLYSYMAGASFMAEEWGMCNTFYDWKEFEISPYGEIKRDFLRFTERYADIGSLMTPIAVVLPAELQVLEKVESDEPILVGYPLPGAAGERIRAVRRAIRELFLASAPMAGDEVRSLRNCVCPDALDLVTADVLRAEDYTYLVDLTGDAAFARAHEKKIIGLREAQDRLAALLPCAFEGSALKLVTETADGGHYLLLLNNSGVRKSVTGGETFLAEESTVVTVAPKDGRGLTMCEGDSTLVRDGDGRYRVTIPAGGWFFGRF